MVSIIIPIYNTEKNLLLRCLQSILQQAYSDYEIIIVDDGCKTLSADDFNQIEQSDPRIRILHQANRGVSAARNLGVTAAAGDYIAFVDGDDEIDPRFLTDSVQLATRMNADLVIGAIQYIREDGSVCEIVENEEPFVFQQNELLTVRRSQLKLSQTDFPYEVLGSPCGRLIRTELCRSVPFHENIHYLEDQLFVRSLLLHANCVVYLHNVWYLYYQYSGSSLHSKDYRTYSLDPLFLGAWNQLNLREPDDTTRSELLIRSLHQYVVSVKFWTISAAKKSSEKISEIKTLYHEQHLEAVVDQLQFRQLRMKDRLVWILLKYHLFRMFFCLLSLQRKQTPT